MEELGQRKKVDNLHPAGWRQHVGYEDLLYPAGSGESSMKILGPTQIGAARPGPKMLGQKEKGDILIPEGWNDGDQDKEEDKQWIQKRVG